MEVKLSDVEVRLFLAKIALSNKWTQAPQLYANSDKNYHIDLEATENDKKAEKQEFYD